MRLEAEHAVGERGGGRRDDDQLEGRPAEVLHDVEDGRRGRSRAARAARAAAPSPARARRRRSAAARPSMQRCRRGRRRRSRAARRGARARGRGARPATITSRLTDRFPQSRRVEEAEDAQPLGYGLDAPLRCLELIDASLRRYEPDQVRRVSSQPGTAGHPGAASLASAPVPYLPSITSVALISTVTSSPSASSRSSALPRVIAATTVWPPMSTVISDMIVPSLTSVTFPGAGCGY